MTTTPTQQPEALQLADRHKERLRQLNNSWNSEWNRSTEEFDLCAKSEDELRRQHAEIARLTAENEALLASQSKTRTSLTDSEWLEYILRNGSKSDVHIATYEGVATTGAHGMVIRLQHDANNLRKLVEAAHGIVEKP